MKGKPPTPQLEARYYAAMAKLCWDRGMTEMARAYEVSAVDCDAEAVKVIRLHVAVGAAKPSNVVPMRRKMAG